MPEKKLKASVRVGHVPNPYKVLTPAEAILVAEAELKACQAWLAIDPETPHREETARRLLDLAVAIGRKP